jgi:hypothetical protein
MRGGGPPQRGQITALGPWEPPRGRSHGQSSLLVRPIGAAQKGAGSKPTKPRHWRASLIVDILIAVLIGAGAFILLVSQK